MRWQGVLKKSGDTWIPGEVAAAPLPHSGHPELLATREGPILHVATSGIHWTSDAGQTWHKLAVPGTAYYPRAVQAADGRIFVFGHVGGDDAYGKVDQSIVMDTFRLVCRDIEIANPHSRPADIWISARSANRSTNCGAELLHGKDKRFLFYYSHDASCCVG